MLDYDFYKAITGLTDKDLELTKDSALDCGNCFTKIPGNILEDAGNAFFLGDYTCEKCNEPLGG